MHRLDAIPAAALAAVLVAGCQSRPCCPPAAREARTPSLAAAAEPAQIFLDTAIVKISEDAVPAALPGYPQRVRVLSASEADALQATWAKTKGVEVIAMPKILTADGQVATMSAGGTDKPPQEAGDPGLRFDADRIFSTADFALRVAPTLSADGRSVVLDLRAGMRGDWKAPSASPPSAATPKTEGVEAAGRVTVPAKGGAALLTAPAALSAPAGRFVFAVLVRVNVRDSTP